MELAAVNAEVVILLREIKELLQIREAREEKLSDPNPKPADEVSADADKNIWAAKQSKVSSGERVDDQVADAAQTVPLEVEVEEDEVIVEGVGSRSPPWNRYDATTPYLPLDSIRHSIGLHSAVIYRQPIKSALEPQWHPGNSWSYWRPIFSVVEDASNEREMTVNCLREGNGYPDYLPEWEIWQENGQWWHIDGACLGPIIEGASDDEGRGSEYALSSSSSGIERAWEWQIRRVVPYSMTPSWNIYFNGEENRESRPSITRITEKCDILDASLGSLYSAPPDWRIHLAFEKDMLRTADRKGKLESYLSEIHEFLTNLHQQGNMQIIDLDDFRMMQCYEWRPPISNVTWSKLDDPRVLARYALEGEHLTLKVPPTVCTLYDAGKRFPKRILGLSQVSWYRIISFRGLASSVRATSSVVYQHQISVDKFCDLMFRDAVSNGGSGANLSELRQVIDLHIRCKSRTKGSNPFVSEWEPFHITWFSIVPDDQERSSAGDWRSGPLYGWSSQMGPRRYHMQEMAFTMGYWPNQIYGSKSRRKPSEYLQPANWHWTILHLAPSHFSQFSETSQRYVFERDGHILPIGLILEAITHAASSWNGIADHLASMITKGDALFDPNKHDGLLFDDSTFSRSRLYFWAIDCLDLFIPSVEANIREWEHFWDAREHLLTAGERLINEFRNHGEKYGDKIHYYTVFPGVEHPLVLVKDQISRLKGTLARLESLRDQLRTLRDGLFNASAVIESRAATELGENVKLLTYVSIFYLPLSFCATLWSIDFSYHPVVFTLVMVLLSIATYLLVMNVNNIVRLGKRIYRRFRSRVVQSMANDPNWVAVGQAFSQFRPERDNTIPSEWKILVFMGSRLWQWVKSLRLRSHSKGDPKAANV